MIREHTPIHRNAPGEIHKHEHALTVSLAFPQHQIQSPRDRTSVQEGLPWALVAGIRYDDFGVDENQYDDDVDDSNSQPAVEIDLSCSPSCDEVWVDI